MSIQAIQILIRTGRRNAGLYLELARAYMEEKREESARDVVVRRRHMHCDDPDVHVGWAELCEELGMARQAIECYQKALELDSENLDSLYRLAFLFSEIGYYEKSAHHLKKILRRDSGHAGARKLLRHCYEALGLHGQARVLSPEKKGPGVRPAERYFPPSISEEDTRNFLELFSGREVGYALQAIDSKTGDISYEFENAPLDHGPIRDHILGKITLAVYPLRSDNSIQYTALSVRIPIRARETYAGQQSYLAFIAEKMRAYVLDLANFAEGCRIPAYAEQSGPQSFRLWFFFLGFIHFLRAKEFLKGFMEHSPKPGSHFVVEPLLPTRPVGIGWVERCIPLPLGIEGTSLERCFFIDQKGEAYGDQLKFLKKVRRFDVKSAIRNLRSLGQVPGVLKTRSESFPPLVERLRRDCKVVDYLVQKALSGHMMRREEKVALFYTIGLLHGGGNTIHRILESTPDYNYRKTERQLERLQRNPVIQDLDSLRGLEGKASAAYFEGFSRGFLAEGVSFSKRVRRPPTDPVNALLSLGYTLLFNSVMGAVSLVGFDPYLGALHAVDYGRPSLALDLMEEWRPLVVDTLVLSVFNLKSLTLEDFVKTGEIEHDSGRDVFEDEGVSESADRTEGTDGKGDVTLPVKLTDAGFRKFIVQFERKMHQKIKHHLTQQQLSYRDCIREQVRHFARVVRGEEKRYQPMISR